MLPWAAGADATGRHLESSWGALLQPHCWQAVTLVKHTFSAVSTTGIALQCLMAGPGAWGPYSSRMMPEQKERWWRPDTDQQSTGKGNVPSTNAGQKSSTKYTQCRVAKAHCGWFVRHTWHASRLPVSPYGCICGGRGPPPATVQCGHHCPTTEDKASALTVVANAGAAGLQQGLMHYITPALKRLTEPEGCQSGRSQVRHAICAAAHTQHEDVVLARWGTLGWPSHSCSGL